MKAGVCNGDLPEVLGRHFVLDERGVALRATWRPARGFINVSLWRDNRCVETFHLTPEAASDFIAFLAHGLASSVPTPSAHSLRVVSATQAEERREGAVRRLAFRVRRRLADDLDAVVHRLRR